MRSDNVSQPKDLQNTESGLRDGVWRVKRTSLLFFDVDTWLH